MENIIHHTGENLKVASGGHWQVTRVDPVYRKVTFKEIQIKDDTDLWTDGEFIFRALVDGVDLGATEVIYAGTDQFTDYEFSIAVKHYPLDARGELNPLVVEFRADELERATLFHHPKNTKVGRFRREFNDEDDSFGIKNPPEPFSNEYLTVKYVIEELKKDDFEKLERIAGEVFTYDADRPTVKQAVKDAVVRLFEVRKTRVDDSTLVSAPGDGKNVKQTAPGTDRIFDITGLDVDTAYQVKVSASGFGTVSQEFTCLHQFVRLPMSRLYFSGRAVRTGGIPVENARVHLYKTMVKLPEELPCFTESDTKKPMKIIAGKKPFEIDAGSYKVVKTAELGGNHWAMIESAKVPEGTTWICYRSGTRSFADMNAGKTTVALKGKLVCFKEPDRKTLIQVAVIKDVRTGAGDYPVLGIAKSKEADYVKIASDKLPYDEGWVCSRWRDSKDRDHHTALLYDEKIKENAATTNKSGVFCAKIEDHPDQLYRVRTVADDYFDGESERKRPTQRDGEILDTVQMQYCEGILPESELVELLPEFKDYYYGDPTVYPYSLRNVTKKTSLAGAGQYMVKDDFPALTLKINCCTFAEALLVKARENSDPDFEWSDELHKKMMIRDVRNDKFSPVTAVKDKGLGFEISKNDLPPPWTIVQGWRDDPNRLVASTGAYVYPTIPDDLPGGHTFLIVDVHTETGRILTLEANKAYSLRGVGFRKLGDFRRKFSDCNPGKDWWKEATLQDWDDFKTIYPFRQLARLRVHDLKWIK